MASTTPRTLRVLAACAVAVAAANHARLAALGQDDVTRHVVFVGANVALAALLLSRSRWALAATAAATLQQIPSHGSDLLRSLARPGHVDWTSVLVLLFWPALLALLVVERRARR